MQIPMVIHLGSHLGFPKRSETGWAIQMVIQKGSQTLTAISLGFRKATLMVIQKETHCQILKGSLMATVTVTQKPKETGSAIQTEIRSDFPKLTG